MNDYWTAWFYSGPYVPSGVIYGIGPSASIWLVSGYEYWYNHHMAIAVIDLYSGPKYRK